MPTKKVANFKGALASSPKGTLKDIEGKPLSVPKELRKRSIPRIAERMSQIDADKKEAVAEVRSPEEEEIAVLKADIMEIERLRPDLGDEVDGQIAAKRQAIEGLRAVLAEAQERAAAEAVRMAAEAGAEKKGKKAESAKEALKEVIEEREREIHTATVLAEYLPQSNYPKDDILNGLTRFCEELLDEKMGEDGAYAAALASEYRKGGELPQVFKARFDATTDKAIAAKVERVLDPAARAEMSAKLKDKGLSVKELTKGFEFKHGPHGAYYRVTRDEAREIMDDALDQQAIALYPLERAAAAIAASRTGSGEDFVRIYAFDLPRLRQLEHAGQVKDKEGVVTERKKLEKRTETARKDPAFSGFESRADGLLAPLSRLEREADSLEVLSTLVRSFEESWPARLKNGFEQALFEISSAAQEQAARFARDLNENRDRLSASAQEVTVILESRGNMDEEHFDASDASHLVAIRQLQEISARIVALQAKISGIKSDINNADFRIPPFRDVPRPMIDEIDAEAENFRRQARPRTGEEMHMLPVFDLMPAFEKLEEAKKELCMDLPTRERILREADGLGDKEYVLPNAHAEFLKLKDSIKGDQKNPALNAIGRIEAAANGKDQSLRQKRAVISEALRNAENANSNDRARKAELEGKTLHFFYGKEITRLKTVIDDREKKIEEIRKEDERLFHAQEACHRLIESARNR